MRQQPGSERPVPGQADPRSRWWRRQPGGATRIATIYAVVGFAWIAFSDRLVVRLSADPLVHERIQTIKGFLFVLVTSAILWVLIQRAERHVRALGAEVRATVDSMADGVLLVDERSRIVEANRAAVVLLGAASKDDVLGPVDDWGRRFLVRSPDGAVVPPEKYVVVRVLAGEPVAEAHAIVRRVDGRDVFLSIAASRVVRPDGPPLAVAVLRDISAARRLDEMREEFLATAAHEFKTPLAVIKAYAQLMTRREPAEQRALAVIQRQVDRLSRLVQHLLDSSRLRLEAGSPRRERFDLAALASEVVDRVRPSTPTHDIEVHADGAVPVFADRERIERVMTCLVENAVRFSPDGGPVRMGITIRDGEARVSVADEGVGIPIERQAQIFERYYRAHAGTAHDYGGLGLGLEMSREVVERQGGRMWFESAPGAGSTFHFCLPVQRESR
jgi:PAS domain S-box-containing protein